MKDLLNANSLANEIRMARAQIAEVFLIVEGDTDSRLFRRLVDKSVRVRAANGRDYAVKTLEILRQAAIRGVVAVVDADFTLVESTPKKQRESKRIFKKTNTAGVKNRKRALPVKSLHTTDEHDLEMMLLRSQALEKMLGEVASEKKLAEFEAQQKVTLRDRLLAGAAPLGYLLWHSLEQGLNLRFEGLTFGDFIDAKTLLAKEREMVAAVKNKSNRHDLKSEELIEQLQARKKPEHDSWQVCCGHHVLELLSFALKKLLGSNDQGEVKRESLEMKLRLAFEREYFREKRLYRALRRWQVSHPPFVLLSR